MIFKNASFFYNKNLPKYDDLNFINFKCFPTLIPFLVPENSDIICFLTKYFSKKANIIFVFCIVFLHFPKNAVVENPGLLYKELTNIFGDNSRISAAFNYFAEDI